MRDIIRKYQPGISNDEGERLLRTKENSPEKQQDSFRSSGGGKVKDTLYKGAA